MTTDLLTLKSVKRVKFVLIVLISIGAIALWLFYSDNTAWQSRVAIETLTSSSSKLNQTSRDLHYNLLGLDYPLDSSIKDFRLDDQICHKDYVNSHRLEQDHPCVIEIIRRHYLHYYPPSALSETGIIPPQHRLDSPDNVVHDPSAGQSAAVLPYLHNKTEGFFVECGAGDGETLSNTLYMERQLKWEGVLIEADRTFFKQILTRKRRHVFALPVCLSLKPYPTEVSFYEDGIAGQIYGEKISIHPEQVTTTTTDDETNFKRRLSNVQCFPLYSILLAVGRTQVDYFSLDVEGSESQILMNVPWHKVNIKTLTVEVTSRSRVVVDSLTRYMQKQGYHKVGLMAGLGYYDLIFVLSNDNKQ